MNAVNLWTCLKIADDWEEYRCETYFQDSDEFVLLGSYPFVWLVLLFDRNRTEVQFSVAASEGGQSHGAPSHIAYTLRFGVRSRDCKDAFTELLTDYEVLRTRALRLLSSLSYIWYPTTRRSRRAVDCPVVSKSASSPASCYIDRQHVQLDLSTVPCNVLLGSQCQSSWTSRY